MIFRMDKRTTLSVVVPVYNEEKDIPRNIPRLHKFLKENYKDFDWEIVIGDNGPSIDRTAQVSKELVKKYSGVAYVLVSRPGRGGALKEIWLSRKSDILVYMDIDLSSDLRFLSSVVEAIKNGSDIAIGSRLKRGAKVYGRTLTREIMSRGYNLLIKLFFWTSFWDAQCGFKAISRETAQKLLPYIKDTAWFFDSELLIIADKAGFRITEVPIIWRDDPRSTVKVAKTAWGDVEGLVRLFLTHPWNKVRNT